MAEELDQASTVRDITPGSACLYYDHSLTFDQEIDYFRSRKSTYLFFLNRYFAFFGYLAVTVLSFSDLSEQVCQRFLLFRQLFLIVNQVLVCVLLTLRVYALYECSLRILTCLLGIGSVLVIIPCWALVGEMTVPAGTASASVGCHVGLLTSTAIRIAGAWEALFVYDSIIFSLILYKTRKIRRDNAVTGIEIPLISLILRDGAIYFSVMTICNLANILFFYFGDPFLRCSLSTFANSISVTLISRLMLNLHRTADAELFITQETSTNVDCNSYYESPASILVIETHTQTCLDSNSTTNTF